MFIPHSKQEMESLLKEIGLKNIQDLFAHIPEKVRKNSEINISPLKDQKQVEHFFRALAKKNTLPDPEKTFLGGGFYNHYIPAPVFEIASRTEYYTAYTPYQPEISQGTLQAMFEFQTMVADLFGMEVSNASMYDGATSAAEAILMARRLEKKNNKNLVLIASNLHPQYIEVIKTYLAPSGIEIGLIPINKNGLVNVDFIEKAFDPFAVVVEYPNFFGLIENLEKIRKVTEEKGAKLITVTTEPLALALFKAPGEYGADIAVGEGQSFGIPLNFGGPGLGLFTTKMAYVRQMPGRIVGETVDVNGNKGFVLTLATREQHIRREKATSNICSNQGLNALMATIYLALLGKEGLKRTAEINYKLSHYAAQKLVSTKKVELIYEGEFFNEFVAKMDSSLYEKLKEKGFYVGLPLEQFSSAWKNLYLITVTEMNSVEKIDELNEMVRKNG